MFNIIKSFATSFASLARSSKDTLEKLKMRFEQKNQHSMDADVYKTVIMTAAYTYRRNK